MKNLFAADKPKRKRRALTDNLMNAKLKAARMKAAEVYRKTDPEKYIDVLGQIQSGLPADRAPSQLEEFVAVRELMNTAGLGGQQGIAAALQGLGQALGPVLAPLLQNAMNNHANERETPNVMVHPQTGKPLRPETPVVAPAVATNGTPLPALAIDAPPPTDAVVTNAEPPAPAPWPTPTAPPPPAPPPPPNDPTLPLNQTGQEQQMQFMIMMLSKMQPPAAAQMIAAHPEPSIADFVGQLVALPDDGLLAGMGELARVNPQFAALYMWLTDREEWFIQCVQELRRIRSSQ